MNPEGVLAAAAVELAGTPYLWKRLLAEHVAGPDGRCHGCRSQVTIAPRWPCRIATLARLASVAAGSAGSD